VNDRRRHEWCSRLRLSDLAKNGQFIRIIEIFPPVLPSPEETKKVQKFDLNLRFERILQGILRTEPLADAFSLPELKDGNRIHLNSVGIATEIKRRTGIAVIPTVTLRDSNKHNLLGTISFALFEGIENILIVRGDPYTNEKSKDPKNVYDISKVSNLISTARNIETHVSNGKGLCILSPINLAKSNDVSYLKTIQERELSGVDIFLAEQMFDEIESYLGRIERVRKFGISKPIVHSIFPIKDYGDGLNLVNKFGWKISEFELENLKKEGPHYGLDMARQRYRALLHRKDLAQGVSISTRGNPEVARFVFK
jgi:5,10-methylenetetrahydrofolate reductase